MTVSLSKHPASFVGDDNMAAVERHSSKGARIGLAWRTPLATPIEDDLGRVKGVRPFGGSIEFGETREQALARELAEELGCDITITGAWLSLENIYRHENVLGHEYIFAANIRLHNALLYRQEEIGFVEHNGAQGIAKWFIPGCLPEGMALFPSGLAPMLQPPTRWQFRSSSLD